MSLSCNGGTPTPDGQPIPAVDLQIFGNPTVDPVGACATRAFGTTNVRVNANSIGIANSPSRRTVLVSPDRFIAPRDTPQTIAFLARGLEFSGRNVVSFADQTAPAAAQGASSILQPILLPVKEGDNEIKGTCSPPTPPGDIIVTKLPADSAGSEVRLTAPCVNGTFTLRPGFPVQSGMKFTARHVVANAESPTSDPVVASQVSTELEHCTASPEVTIHRAFVSPENLADAFGRRIADRFVAIQITIGNENRDFQYLIHNVTINYRQVLWGFLQKEVPNATAATLESMCGPENQNACKASSADLSMLRGVAEKGAAFDRRNLSLRILEGIGTLAGGLTGIPIRGPTYSRAVAIFSGPLVNAYARIFPDFTINQLNRLNDLAYVTNTVIPKQQGRVVVAFLPQPLFLDKDAQKRFRVDAGEFLTKAVPSFRLIGICVTGVHIAETNDLAPNVNAVVITSNPSSFAVDQPEVKGYLVGQFFSGGDLQIAGPPGTTITRDGPPSDSRYNFTIKSTTPIPPGTTLDIEVVKANAAGHKSLTIAYVLPLPTITGGVPGSIKADGQPNKITLTGLNFVKGATTVEISGSGLTFDPIESESSSTKLAGNLVAESGAATGPRTFTVKVFGQSSSSQMLKVTQ